MSRAVPPRCECPTYHYGTRKINFKQYKNPRSDMPTISPLTPPCPPLLHVTLCCTPSPCPCAFLFSRPNTKHEPTHDF